MNTEPQDRIDDYLLGRHPDPEAFERELEQNPQLRQDMEATRLALDAITLGEDQVLKDRLRQLDAQQPLTVQTPVAETQTTAKVIPLQPRRRRTWVRYAAAAAVICLLAGYFLLRPAPGERVNYALSQVEPYDNIAYSITKGANDPDPRAAAYTAYEAGDYAAAEAAFDRLDGIGVNDEFYLAQSLLAQGKYEAAQSRFLRLSTAADFNLRQEATFYEAVARLGLGQTAEATGVLEAIGNDGNHPMHEAAVALLSRLR